jgi:hypothetical protein
MVLLKARLDGGSSLVFPLFSDEGVARHSAHRETTGRRKSADSSDWDEWPIFVTTDML